jgi:hypothetical protein
MHGKIYPVLKKKSSDEQINGDYQKVADNAKDSCPVSNPDGEKTNQKSNNGLLQ